MSKPVLGVTCAVIEKDGLILAVQRKSGGHLSLKWEFPGGKTEPGETPEDCIVREIREELNLTIRIIRKGPLVDHDYGPVLIRMQSYLCGILEGDLVLTDHADFLWLLPEHLSGLDWAAADLPVVGWVKAGCN